MRVALAAFCSNHPRPFAAMFRDDFLHSDESDGEEVIRSLEDYDQEMLRAEAEERDASDCGGVLGDQESSDGSDCEPLVAPRREGIDEAPLTPTIAPEASCPASQTAVSRPARQKAARNPRREKDHSKKASRQRSKKQKADDDDPGLTRIGRPLKRRASAERPDEVTCEARLCVWGRAIKTPAVVYPLVTIGNKRWFQVSERSWWLRRACEPARGLTTWKPRFQHAVSELRRVIKEEMCQKFQGLAATSAHLRQTIGLEEEDVEEASGQKRVRVKPTSEEATIDLNGTAINVRTQERPPMIEATQKAVMAVITFCNKVAETGEPQLKRDRRKMAQTSEERFVLPPETCRPITGKVTWHPSVSAWSIHIKDASGKRVQKRFRAEQTEAPKVSAASFLSGAPATLGPSVIMEERAKAYWAAVEAWNELDKSTRERIPVQPEHAGSSLPGTTA